MTWVELIERLIGSGVLKTPEVVKAFNKLDRRDFVDDHQQTIADSDQPLPIGLGQTISQPTTVAFMIELLKVQPGQIVLDVGSGSGWTSAILAELVGNRGRVYAVERMAKLKKLGEENVKRLGYRNTQFITGDGSLGLPDQAPFDRILVSASVPQLPLSLKNQLSENHGRMVIPIGKFSSSINLVKRKDQNTFTQKEYPGFTFVPLIGREGFSS